MRPFIFFFILCGVWFGDMIVMVAIAPMSSNPVWFSGLYCLGHILMIFLVLNFPVNISPRKSLAIILILGVMARILFWWYPLGNDIFRYVWEGYIQSLGFNPYIMAPAHPALETAAKGELNSVWQQINQPQFSAAYPPLVLLLFRGIAGLLPAPMLFKLVMVLSDIGVMTIIMLMVDHQRIKPCRLLLYAANPLVLVYTAGEGHLDVVQIFFLCLALYLILCKKYQFTGFLILGLAVVSKYFALITLPFLVNVENRWKSLAVLIPLILYVPFLDAGTGLFRSLGLFASHYHYNDAIAVLIRLLFGDLHLFATAILLAAGLAWIYLVVHDRLRSVYIALGLLLLLLPTLHPWYLVLIAPFLVFFPSQAWLYLQVAVVFTFPVGVIEAQSGIFQEISWLKWLEYIPFYVLLCWGLVRDGYILRERSYGEPKFISAIVPTLNEENSIGRCLAALKNRTALKEIIVADGGSEDGTRAIAIGGGARVVDSRAGRGIQIRQGIRAATGDIIIILHADCLAVSGSFEGLMQSLKGQPHVVGGAFRMQFEPKNLKTRLIATLNNMRALLTGISFGDQAQFFRRQALVHLGDFPLMMLMEDVELALRLKETGALLFLRDGIVVSDRRWSTNRFAGNLLTVLYLFSRYLLQRRWGEIDGSMREYYERYYP